MVDSVPKLMKIARGIRLVIKAICTAIFTYIRFQFCFSWGAIRAVIIGVSSKISVVIIMVCGKLGIYFYLELHQEL